MAILPGVARKLSLPFIILSIAGWILFGVGFGIRNFTYRELSEQTLGLTGLEHAAKPEFFLFWAFLAGGLVLFIFSFLYSFWDHAISKLLFNIFNLVFLLGAGGVLLVDGLTLYQFYQIQNNSLPLLFCNDIYRPLSLQPDIHGQESFVAIEFAGVIVAVFFHFIYLIVSSFFISPKKIYA